MDNDIKNNDNMVELTGIPIIDNRCPICNEILTLGGEEGSLECLNENGHTDFFQKLIDDLEKKEQSEEL